MSCGCKLRRSPTPRPKAGPPNAIARPSYAWVARSHKIDYLLPAHVGDELIVYTWVADMQRVKFLATLRNHPVQDQAILARAETRWVFVDLASRKPIRIPPEVQVDFELVPNGLASQ